MSARLSALIRSLLILAILANLIPPPPLVRAAVSHDAPGTSLRDARSPAPSPQSTIPPTWLPIFTLPPGDPARTLRQAGPPARVQLALQTVANAERGQPQRAYWLAAHVVDADGLPVKDGTAVHFGASQGDLEQDVVPTAGGVATTRLTVVPGRGATLTAQAGGAQDTQQLAPGGLEKTPALHLRRADAAYGARAQAVARARNALRQEGTGLVAENRTRRVELGADGLVYHLQVHDQPLGARPAAARALSLGFQLTGVRIGRTPLTPGHTPQANGNWASYPAPGAGWQVAYEVGDATVEQYFIFEERALLGKDDGDPSSGSGQALVIEGVFQTALQPSLLSDEEGIRFTAPGSESNTAEALGYGPARVADAGGRRTTARLELRGKRLRITLPADWLARAEFPVVVDPLIGPAELVSDVQGEAYRPSVASDGSDFLAVWDWNGDVYGQLVDANGALAGELLALSQGDGPQHGADVAYNPASDEYLVIWADERAGWPYLSLYARRVSTDGVALGQEIAVVSPTRYLGYYGGPQVAASEAGDYALVWSRHDDDSDFDVLGQMLDASGALSGTVISLSLASGVQRYPELAYDDQADVFQVVWADRRDGNEYDLYGQRLDANGALLGDNQRLVNTSGQDVHRPAIAANDQGQFLVAWYQAIASGDHDVFATRVAAASGQVEGSRISIDASSGYDWSPAVTAIASGQYLVTWAENNYRINARRVGSDGSLPGTPLEEIDHGKRPAVAYGGGQSGSTELTEVLALWEDPHTAGQRLITGQRLSNADATLGDLIYVSPYYSLRERVDVAYHPQAGEYLLAWQQAAAAPNPDVLIQRVDAQGQPITMPLNLSAHAAAQERPALAAGQDGYLVAWRDRRDEASSGLDIYGHLLDASGALSGTQIAICTVTDTQSNPMLAYNSRRDEYLVVWDDYRSGGEPDIHGQIVGADGALGGAFGLTVAGRQAYPDVAYDPDRDTYLVVWEDDRPGTPGHDIYGQVISASGTLVGGDFLVASAAEDQYDPVLAYGHNQQRYLVSWWDRRDGSWDIYGQVVSGTGALVGGNLAIATRNGHSTDYQEFPAIATRPLASDDEFVLVWQDRRNDYDRDVYLQRVDGDGNLLDEADTPADETDPTVNRPVAADVTAYYERPVVAYNADAGVYLVAWNDRDDGGVYAQRYASAGLAAPLASFEAAPTAGLVPLRVVFSDTSTGQIGARRWDFGDGSDPLLTRDTWAVHTYTAAGAFTATLTVSNPWGADAAGATITAGAQTTPTLDEDFEDQAWESDPLYWLDQSWDTTARDDFEVLYDAGNRVYGTDYANDLTIYSTYAIPGWDEWQNYEYRGRMRLTDANGGLGVAFYSQYPDDEENVYALRRWSGSPAFELKAYGDDVSIAGDTGSGVTPIPNTWYHFRVQAATQPDRVTFRAKVWPEGQAEPAAWQVDGYDGGATRPTSGAVAVRTYGPGSKHFDDLLVTPLALQADFGAGARSGLAPHAVTFVAQPIGEVYTYTWDFGDGTAPLVSAVPTATHSYDEGGDYDVTLTVAGPAGSDALTRTDYVQVTTLEMGLQGHWRLDENGGTRQDSSANGNHLSDYNTVGSVSGQVGLAADLEQDDDEYLAIAHAVQSGLAITGSLTLAGWVRPESDGYVILASKYEYGVNNRAYRLDLRAGGALGLIVSPDGSYSYSDHVLETDPLLDVGTWYHVTGVFDAGAQTLAIYLGGDLVVSRTVAYDHVYAGTAPFMLGANLNNGNVTQHFDGLLDEWRVYDRALSEAEIEALTITSTLSADFSAAPLLGAVPLTVTFSNLSTGASGYEWSFGDGPSGTSTLTNPVHVYTQTGSYTVVLTATNESESDVEVKSGYISVTAETPLTVTAGFAGEPVSGTAPLLVTFTNLSTSSGEIDGYEWSFGDGESSAVAHPTHVYAQPGHYTVTLTATVGTEHDVEVKNDYIVVTEAVPVIVQAPLITLTAPAEGALLGVGEVQVTGVVSDDGTVAGVWVNEITATLDGAAFNVTLALDSGNQTINAVAEDDAGAFGFDSRVVHVDGEGPQIEIHAPQDQGAVYTLTPTIAISYTDFYTGVDTTTFSATLSDENGTPTDVTADLSVSSGGASGQLSTPLSEDTSYTLTVSVDDALGNSGAATVTFYVPTAPAAITPPVEPEAAGWVSGVVYDSSTCDAHLTACEGLAGAQVTLSYSGSLTHTLPGVAVTGPEGFFAFPAAETGQYWVRVEKQGFTYAQRQATIVQGRSSATNDVYLTPLDTAVTVISYPLTQTVVHTNTDETLVLEIPAGAIAPGETVSVTATNFEHVEFLPSGGLPEGTWETYAFNLGGDSEVTFTQPITVRVSNSLSFAPGISIPLGYWNQASQAWEHAGTGVVDASGAWVEMQVTHFSNYDCNDPISSSGGGASGSSGGSGGPPPPCSNGLEGCWIDLKSGFLQEWVDLPPVYVLGRATAPQLRYGTWRAHPAAVIDVQLDLDVVGDIDGDHVGWELYIEGQKTDSFTFAADLGSSGEVGRYRYYWDGRNARGERLPPGVYAYQVKFNLPYSAQYCYALDGVFGNPPDCENGATGVYVDAVQEVWSYGTVILSGELDGPLGDGWLLDRQERLYETQDGRILIDDGRSAVEFYLPWKDRTRSDNVDGRLAWVNGEAETMQVVAESLARNWPGMISEVGNGPHSIVLSPDGSRAYVTNDSDSSLSVLDLTATPPQELHAIDVSNSAYDVALSPNGDLAYVTVNSLIEQGNVQVVDLAAQEVTGTVAVGQDARGIALSPDGSRAYVANYDDGTLSVLDLVALTEIATISVGTNPQDVALAADGSLAYVTNYGSNSLSVIDLALQVVTDTVSLSGSPHSVVLSPQEDQAYVTLYGADDLAVIDLTATPPAQVDSVEVGDGPQGIALSPQGEHAYVMNRLDNNVSVVDLTLRQQVTTIGVGRYPVNAVSSPDGERLYVTNYDDDAVSVLDLPAQEQIGSVGVERDPQDVVLSPDGNQAYVTNYSDDSLSVVDLASGDATRIALGINARPRGLALSPQGDLAYVVYDLADQVGVVDLVAQTVTDTIEVGDGPRHIAVAADGELAYVTNYRDNSLSVVSLTTTQELTTIAVGRYPLGVALSPDGRWAYVANNYDDDVSVVDLAAQVETDTISVRDGPRGIALSPDGKWAYVTNYNSDQVSVLDLGEDVRQEVAVIGVGDGPEDIASSPDGAYAYVSNSNNDDTISVLDLASRQVVGTIGAQDDPVGIALWGAPPSTVESSTDFDHSRLTYDPGSGSYTRSYPDGVQVHFNPDGSHDTTLEPSGRETVYTYASAPFSASNPNGTLATMSITATDVITPWVWSFTYQDGKLSGVTDPAGRSTAFAVDGNGQLTQVDFADGSSRQFYYDARGLLTQQVDQEGHVSAYVYDDYGRVVQHVGPQREVYDPSSGESTASREVKTLTPSDSAYALINDSAVGDPDDPAPAVITSTLLVDAVALERGGSSGHTNEWGYWLDESDGLGRTTTYAYDAASNPTRLTWPVGNCAEATYDELGNPLSAARMGAAQCALAPGLRDPAQVQTVTLIYEPRFNRIKTSVDPLGRVTTYYYDYELGLGEAGNLVRTEYPPVQVENGLLVTPVVSTTYNSWGLRETETDERGTVTRYKYTDSGLLTQIIQDDGPSAGSGQALKLTTVYTDFDALGNALTVIGPGGVYVTRRLYDAWGRVISETNAADVTTLYEYDGRGNLARQVTDAGGDQVVTEYEYDAEGQLVSQRTSADGQKVQTGSAYDVNGNAAQQEDGLGRQTLSAYDDADQLINTIDPAGHVMTYTYDLNGRMEAVTNADGTVTHSEYNDWGRLSRNVINWDDGVFDPNEPDADVETRYRYDAAGNTIIVTDTLNRMTRTWYDGRDRVLGHIANWDGSATLDDCTTLPTVRDENICTRYVYDLVGNTVIVTDTLGRMTRTFYDALGRVEARVINWNPATLGAPDDCVLSLTNESVENVCTLYGYDAAGNQITTTNALNQTSLTVYDAANRPVINVANWDGTLIESETDCNFPPAQPDTNLCTVAYYDAHGRRSGIKDPLGKLIEYDYDDLGRLVTTTRFLDSVPVATVNHYDILGNRVGQTDPLGRTTTYVHDELNRLVATANPEGSVTTWGYNAAGWIITTTDSIGHATVADYDALGQQVAVSDAEGNVTRYGYDGLGNQVAVTDAIPAGGTQADGIVTRYEQDGLDRLTAVVENERIGESANPYTNVRTEYVYDALGNRIVITNARGYTSTYTVYDTLNRPVAVKDVLGHETRTRYDALGYRTVVTDANGAVTRYSYDGLNRLIAVHYEADGVTVEYEYDAVGNRTTMTDSLGTTRYAYDDLYRLVSVTDPFTGTVEYGYDLVGNRTQIVYPDGQVVTYTYDADDRLVQVEDWDDGLTSYAYDEAGRLTLATLPNGVRSTYDHDAANRLTTIAHKNASDDLLARYAYILDGVGNRLQVTETISTPGQGLATTAITYTYDSLYRLTGADYSSGERFAYQYDAVSNMTALTATITNTVVTTKAYDAVNRLITVTTGGVMRTLDWSSAGELLRDGGDTYQWNTAGRLISATVDGVTSHYAYLGDGGRISMTVGGETTTYTLDLAAPLVQVLITNEGEESTVYVYGVARIGEYDSEWHYHLADHLGSVRSLVAADGGVMGTRAYQPYGMLLSTAGNTSSIYGFTGEQTDPAGLIYLRARMYSPTQSQFLTRDLWKGDNQQPLTLNPYLYALGNPVNLTDPSGYSPCCPPGDRCCTPGPCTHPFRFVTLPILRRLRWVQWFGDTVFASNNRGKYTYSGGLHAGFDLSAPIGSNIFAGMYGTVVDVKQQVTVFEPNYVIIRPKSPLNECQCVVNRVVLYGHMGPPTVKVGDDVQPGTLIGHVEAIEKHLHLEIRDYRDDYKHFTSNHWFYNPAYFLAPYWMNHLQKVATTQSSRTTVTFVGDSSSTGDPYTQPEKIPR